MNLKKVFLIVFIFTFVLTSLFSQQHRVNDIMEYNGWYKIKFDISQSKNVKYYITQCYPSGEEYEVTGNEREKLPLYIKILIMGIIDVGMLDRFDFNKMSFDEFSFSLFLSSFSYTFVLNNLKSEAEIIEDLGGCEIVNKYKDKKWP